ncbi:MAG: hypothetical protein J0L96_19240, partial [Anaerolineae bacterium]|nr:hypothetical protein [Anaerolineae bacterium]
MKSTKILTSLFVLMMLVALLTSTSPVQAGMSQIPLTASGDLVWAKGFGGTGNDGGFGIITDTSGNSYVVGEFQNTVDFDPGAGTTNLTSAGSTDGFITKFDSSGAFVWVKQFGSTLADRAVEVKLDSNNDLYITGYFRGTVDFDPGAGTTNRTSNGENDIFLLKLNSSGGFVWAKSFGSTQYDEGVDLVLDSSNNIHLLSDFTGTVDFDPGASTNNLTSNSANFFDIAVTKLDGNGDFIWAKGFGSTSEEYAGGIEVGESGNVFVTGNFDGTVDFNPDAGVFNLTSSFYDIFVSTLDSNGQFLWAARVGGSGIEEGNDIALDSADNIYVVGNYQNTVDFNPKGDNFYLSSNGQWDSYVLKLDQLGNFMWARTLGSAGDDFALNIILDSNNNLYIAGDFTNTVDFNPGTGTYNLTSAGGYDAYTVKLKSNGNFVWARSVGGSTNDLASGIALDSSNNNVHITGWFSGTADFDPGAGTNNITSIGGNDIFILKLQGTAPVSPAQTPGSLDLTFDKDGLVTTSINSYTDQAYSVDIQTDGKILVAGGFSNPGYDDFFVLRYNSNGALDTSFGTGGVAQTDFGGDDVAQTIKVQSDGKIIVAGYTSPNGAAADFALARYNPNGSLDTTFGTNGKTTTSIVGSGYDIITDMAIQSDGKIIALGYANVGINNNGIVVVRYNTNGSLDTSFDIDGILSLNLSNSDDFGTSVEIQTDQKIIVGGTTFNGSNSDFAVIRLNSEGSLDTEFNTDGIATLDFGGQDWGAFLAIQQDGKIIVGGSDGNYNYLIARLNGNGNLDLSFDTDGKASTYLGFGYATVLDAALQSNGKVILAGYTNNSGITDYDFTMVRYNQNGSLDTSFGVNGMVFTDFGSFDADLGNAVAIQSDGKIVMAGYRHIDGIDHDVALARFIGDEALPTITSLTRASTSPTSASSVDFTVTFSKSVQNVDVNDFSLFTTGVTGASVTSVTPVSASVYTVAVNTGSGNGTIRLDVPDTATITDLSSNGLTGIPFTSGETYTITKSPVASIDVTIGGVNRGSYNLAQGSSQRVNYAGLDAGPVVVDATNDVPIIAALRDAYFVNGKVESFVQLMGLPEAALSTK